MNNRGVPRYLGQQQVVRRLLVNRMPGPPSPPVMQPRQPVILYAPRPRFAVHPNSKSVIMGAPQFVTRPAGPPPSVTVPADTKYLQYSDPLIDDFQYNQSQIVSVDNSRNYSSNFAQYEEQTYHQRQSQSQTYPQQVQQMTSA